MRQIFLDTETTGLEPKQGHRMVEVAAVEMNHRQLTGRHFHYYLNPGRESDPGALQVHGLTMHFLKDKHKFPEITEEFMAFIDGAELIIHNAPFDVGFLDLELGLAKLNPLESYCAAITDTLKIAKDLHPGKRNNLDALCDRYQIDNSKRTLHGALLDAELLADVYLAMTRGQESLLIDNDDALTDIGAKIDINSLTLVTLSASQEELDLHQQKLDNIEQESQGKCLWKQLESSDELKSSSS